MEAFCGKYDAVEGYLVVSNPPSQDLATLSCLKCVSGGLGVYYADQLLSLDGLEALRWGGGLGLILADLARLERVDALSDLQVDQYLDLYELASLTDASGLENIVGPREIGVDYVPLNDLSFLGWTDELDYLMVHAMPALTNLDGLENLRTVGEFAIVSNFLLTDVSGLSGLTEVDVLGFAGNRALASIDLPSLIRVNDGLAVESTALVDLSDFPPIETLPSYLLVRSNPNLESLVGMEGLRSVGTLAIGQNERLVDLTGLEGLETATDPSIVSNPSLETLQGLNSLTTIDESLWIWDNDALRSLAGLDSLTTLADVSIDDNDALVSFDGAESLATVNSLGIYNNDVLEDLSALHNLTWVGDLSIRGNPSLPQAEIDALLDAIGAENIHGTITIEDNGP